MIERSDCNKTAGADASAVFVAVRPVRDEVMVLPHQKRPRRRCWSAAMEIDDLPSIFHVNTLDEMCADFDAFVMLVSSVTT